jgi:cobalt-zinc-cadmium efflux system outer membrane protein
MYPRSANRSALSAKLAILMMAGCFLGGMNGFPQEQILTIQDAVVKAQNENPELNQLRAQVRKKEEEWRTQTGIQPPSISYFKEGIDKDQDLPFSEQRLSVSQTIDSPVAMVHRMKKLSRETRALQFQLQAQEKLIRAETKKRYIEVLYALYSLEVRKEQNMLSQNLFEAVSLRAETGVATGMDLLKAEIQLDEALNDYAETERLINESRYELFGLLGIDPEEQKYSIAFQDTMVITRDEISQEMALEVIEQQPQYLAALQATEAADYQLSQARSDVFPDIRFSYYTQDYGTGFQYNGFEVGLSIPLWFPLERRGAIRMARAEKERIEWERISIQLEMKKQIEHAWHNYEKYKEVIDRYESTLREKAAQLQSLTLEAYQAGEIDLLNLLVAQQIFLSSKQRYLSALRNYYIQIVELEKFLDTDLLI